MGASFTETLNHFNCLRIRLQTIDPAFYIEEVGQKAPNNTNNELAFMRIVLWGYGLLYENAKVHLLFLIEKPSIFNDLRVLRTYIAHNLSFNKKNDTKVMKLAHSWFKSVSGCVDPQTNEQWEICCEHLLLGINEILQEAISACNILEDEEDAESNIKEFKNRLEKNWQASEFDKYVLDTVHKLGYQGLNIVEFRSAHLERWRNIVKLGDSSNIQSLLKQRIESDLLKHMSNALPVSLEELSEMIDLSKNGLIAFAIILQMKVKPESNLQDILVSVAEELVHNKESTV